MTGEKLPPPDERARCEELAERISHYHDDRWPKGSAECTEVEAHLAECPRCAELLDDYRAITSAARLVRSTDAPPADAERMSRRVRTRLRSRVFKRRLKWAGAGVGFAAAAAAAVVALMVMPGSPPPAGENLAREETKPAVERPASDVADPAGPSENTGPEVAEARAVVAGAGTRGHGADRADRKEPVRGIEDLGRRRARRPADGVRFVGEGTEPRRVRPPPAPRATVAPAPPLLGVVLAHRGDPGKTPVVVVDGVVAGSPADRAGLKPGDVVLAIDAQSVRGRSLEAIAGIIRRAGPGARITITYARHGRTRKADVVLAGER